MNDTESLSHSVWDCKYRIVWIPKCRRKLLYGRIRKELGRVFHELARQRESKIHEGHLHGDHVHMYISIPPKYAVSAVIGQMKQYTASRLREKFVWLEKVYWNEPVVWSPGYFVSTVGLNEAQVMEYVKWQAHQDSGQAKLDL